MIVKYKAVLFAGCFAVLAGCSEPGPAEVDATGLEVHLLSSLPEQVSGGTVLISLGGDRAVEVAQRGSFSVQGTELTVLRRHTREAGDDSVREEILLGGLEPGDNVLTITDEQGRDVARLAVTNHPVSGPIFSGPQQYPLVCSGVRQWGIQPLVDHDEDWGFPVYADDGQGDLLGYSKDCMIEPRVDYVYLTTEGSYQPLPPDGSRPADMARTVLTDGREVDFIVRWERGTVNRFLYSYAILADGDQLTNDPLQPGTVHWNGRLLYIFEGGVGVGHYQGRVDDMRGRLPEALALGYAIAYSSGNSTAEHFNLQVGGETALMVKEHFIKRFGEPRYTVGLGGSGGAIQQYIYQQNHPGLLDGGIAQYSYPDMVSQIIHVGDCELLEHYMDVTDKDNPRWRETGNRSQLIGFNATDDVPDPLAPIKQQLGYGAAPGSTECTAAWRGLTPLAMNPQYGGVPDQDLMHPPGLMDDVVWTHFDDLRQITGVDDNGWARIPWDNTGVQYGLVALREGELTPEEFLHLNAHVGGWKHPSQMVQEGYPFIGEPEAGNFDPWSRRNMLLSPDGVQVAPRTRGDTEAVQALFESGMVFDGQLDIPIIDWRHYLEHTLDMHNTQQSFVARQRIVNRMGHSANQSIWITDARPERIHDQTEMALAVMHEWIEAIQADPAAGIAGNRPAAAQDACFAADGALIAQGDNVWNGVLSNDATSDEMGECAQHFPVFSTPRVAAGAPTEGNVFQCQLKTVDVAINDGTYGKWVPNEAERQRLQEIFPEGVCDYSRPGQGDQVNRR